jgi:hypothetical protein
MASVPVNALALFTPVKILVMNPRFWFKIRNDLRFIHFLYNPVAFHATMERPDLF